MAEQSLSLLDKIESLSPELKAEVEDFVDFLHARQRRRTRRELSTDTAADLSRAEQSMRWINSRRAEYAGQWVVMDGERLIAHGTNAKECFERAKEMGVEVPFLAFIEPETEGGSMGGWV